MAHRIIKYEEIGPSIEQQITKLLEVVVFETDKALKKESPVDTGRFRASWAISQDVDISTPIARDPSKEKDRIKGEVVYQTAPRPIKVNYSQERLGHSYTINNAIEYALPLALGHSPQARAGWIENVAKRMQRMVDKNYAKILRSS